MRESLKIRYPDIYQRWFNEGHAAVRIDYTNPPELTHLPAPIFIRWSRPDNVTYRVDYLFFGNTMFVKGDIGEAAYCWNQMVTPEFVAGCDLGYFAEKNAAAEHRTHRGRSWSSRKAERWVVDFCERMAKDMQESGDGQPHDPPENYDETLPENVAAELAICKKKVEEKLDDQVPFWMESCHSQQEFAQMLCEHPKFFGEDAVYDGGDAGMDYDLRTVGHLVGLQLALEYMSKEKTTTTHEL